MSKVKTIHALKSTHFDLLVIGGGITGAGIALDAVARGLKVALVDKGDFASGTSSKSTKLIHGGLRYLKQLEFGLVREVGHERTIAHRNAIHLVKPRKMLLPIYKGGSMGLWMASLGVYLYDMLAGVKPAERRKVLSAARAIEYEPALPANNLLGAILYTEYVTDDARLTLEVMKKASEMGAICQNYCEAIAPVLKNEKVAGFQAKYKITDEEFVIQAKAVINASGPWTDELREKVEQIEGKKLVLSKGVHLVFDRDKIPVKGAMYIDVKFDPGRMIFIIPRHRAVYVGTTDTIHTDKADLCEVNPEDTDYILKALHAFFDTIQLTRQDVESSWAGHRPLIGSQHKKTTELSRKDEIFISKSGLLSIAGGKLTGYRKMAERAVEETARLSGFDLPKSNTANIKLSGAEFDSEKDYQLFLEKCISECRQLPAGIDEVANLVQRYGSNSSLIIEWAYDIFNMNRIHPNPLLEAEIKYVIENEFALKPADYFIRRSGLLYFHIDKIQSIKALVYQYFQKYTGIDAFTSAIYVDEFETEFRKSKPA